MKRKLQLMPAIGWAIVAIKLISSWVDFVILQNQQAFRDDCTMLHPWRINNNMPALALISILSAHS